MPGAEHSEEDILAVAPNYKKPARRVRHKELVRWSEDSAYKSTCPVCRNGILLMRRDPKTFALLKADHCISCGQAYEYMDKTINGEEVVDE